jgi:hypothetical protein
VSSSRGWGLEAGDWGTKACLPLAGAGITRSICSAAQESLLALKRILFLRELCADVYENKGPATDGRSQSRNVIENKGGYTLIARMLLKIR